MKMTDTQRRVRRAALLAGAAVALAMPAMVPVHAVAQEAGALEEIVVTGSRIRAPNLVSTSPVTAVTGEDIKAQGVTRVEDLVNSLPQAFAAQGGQVSNGSTGTATVNLRGLGSSRTLVLIDGRRLMPGDPSVPSPDLNFIPSSLVQRVDVNTGGASAVYGSDAIAGVVNFIMERDFEGVRVDVQHGFYMHHNENDDVQSIIRAKSASASVPTDFAVPDSNVTDGEQSEATLVIGANSADGKGNVTAYAGYREIKAVLQGDRDFSACSLNSGDVFTCGGSGTAYPARFGNWVVDPAGPGNTFRARNASTDVYNFGPTNYYQRPDERYVLGAFAHYEIQPWADVYADVMYMDDRSIYQIAPGGIFAGTFSVNCDNPFMTPTQQQQLCGANAGTQNNFTGTIARRNIEGGGRQGDMRHSAYRFVTGVRGDITDEWNYDAYLQYGATSFNRAQTGFFQTQKIRNALIARRDANGNIVCQAAIDGSDTSCVPYNIFKIGGVTQEALDYLETPSYATGNTEEMILSASLAGDLTNYGVVSPFATSGVGVAFGIEYRSEYLDSASDYTAAAGLLNGSGGASLPVEGDFDTKEIYGEIRIPLVEDKPFAQSLELDAGFRYSEYSSVGSTDAYKAGLIWSPVSDLRFRGSFQRAVRAPNILELYDPQVVQLDGSTDPCAGLSAGDALVARCAQAFGLTAAQVLAIEENPASQYNGQNGGNPNLDPETSDTYSIGVVLTPEFAPGLTVSFDYFDIKVEDYISGIGADLIISRCLETLDPYFCGLVNRDANGSLWLSDQGYITNTTLNTGSLKTTGIDVNIDYSLDLEDVGLNNAGSLAFTMAGTWLDTLKTQPLPNDKAYDCTGYYGTVCGTPNPEWRHKARLTWTTPITGLTLSTQWRYYSKAELDATSDQPGLNNPAQVAGTDLKLGTQNYFDATITYQFLESYTLRIGANNIFDRDPPLTGSANCPTGPCNGNTWPQVYQDAMGRYVFVGLTAKY
ncbi:TonB-dependent receptor domain-containing protein [Rhodospirillum centenum]|uniref:TonB-dependent receptor, putative n=1 Tax=Rhodospirillum centenum (strain ATCC 51521 / SW) TaxID=414684 RepID=B6IRD0_RHOCS|nr:TonB-dependent receptor [Rhodospirillum centenum]ACI98016.1 TonB-dependent receptor, putative [Rhodospirillum centenum SW]